MKVACVLNNLSGGVLTPETVARLKRYISLPDGELGLVIGKEYTVYGVEFRDNCPWFYICIDEQDVYPVPLAADFFRITDKRLSAHWQLGFKEANNGKNQAQLVFFEWAADRFFYESLIDGDDRTMAVFNKYRKIMEEE